MIEEIPTSISFSETIVDFESYFSMYDTSHYAGNLRKWLDSGELIEIEERVFLSEKSIGMKKLWFNNYESLCLGLKHSNEDSFGIQQLRNWFDSNAMPFSEYGNDFFNSTCNDIGIDILFKILINGIYKQPLLYLDALDKYPDEEYIDQTIYFRQKYIYDEIRRIDYKCQELFIGIKGKLSLLAQKEPDEMLTALKGVFLIVDNTLNNLMCGHSDYNFDFRSSPLVIVMLEFLKDLKSYSTFCGGNNDLPNIDKYLRDLDKNKMKFENENCKDEITLPLETISHDRNKEKVERVLTSLTKSNIINTNQNHSLKI